MKTAKYQQKAFWVTDYVLSSRTPDPELYREANLLAKQLGSTVNELGCLLWQDAIQRVKRRGATQLRKRMEERRTALKAKRQVLSVKEEVTAEISTT